MPQWFNNLATFPGSVFVIFKSLSIVPLCYLCGVGLTQHRKNQFKTGHVIAQILSFQTTGRFDRKVMCSLYPPFAQFRITWLYALDAVCQQHVKKNKVWIEPRNLWFRLPKVRQYFIVDLS
ncbi:MAG TPA: hypothetical protein VHO84_00625 [Syntrophorhabdaceae bacterium]|nr:hypothetical protein [Syntrophorhabdaceae bacterium]